MKVPFVDLKIQYQHLKEEIDQAIFDVIEHTAFIGGEKVQTFENSFAEKYGVNHCIGTGNGTDAIYIGLKMLGVGPGDEVITTAHSWISTSETISQTGATPVFVDIDNFYTLDVSKIESKVNGNTKAIIPVHIYGQMCDMNAIMGIAKRHDLFVIEDCAQSHFSELGGTRAGLFGNLATFSFYPGKNLGAYGDAGCIITNDADLAEKCRMYSNHGALIKHQHKIEGINSRLDGMQASILSVKLNHIESWTQRRVENANYYTQKLGSLSENVQTPSIRPNSQHSFHVYCIQVSDREDLQKHLNSKDVQTAIHYPTILPMLEAYNYLNHKKEDFPRASHNQERILSLPMFPEIAQEQMDYVVDSIIEFYS